MSESRLYTFSQETKEQLRKFRLGTSRASTPLAKIYQIDTKTQEIKPSSDDTYSEMPELADELPDSSPRFILLSYPLTLVRCMMVHPEPCSFFSDPFPRNYVCEPSP